MDRCWLLIGAPAQRPQIRSGVVDSKAPLFHGDHLEHREQPHRHPLAHLDAEQSLYRQVISSAHGRGVRLVQEGVRFWRVQDAL